MNCTVDNIGELPVFWNKKLRGITTDQTVVSVNNNKLVNDPRYELVFVNGTQQTFSLKVNSMFISILILKKYLIFYRLTTFKYMTLEFMNVKWLLILQQKSHNL